MRLKLNSVFININPIKLNGGIGNNFCKRNEKQEILG